MILTYVFVDRFAATHCTNSLVPATRFGITR